MSDWIEGNLENLAPYQVDEIEERIDEYFVEEMIYLMFFAISVFCRILIRVYLTCKWFNISVDPTYIESKLRFY